MDAKLEEILGVLSGVLQGKKAPSAVAPKIHLAINQVKKVQTRHKKCQYEPELWYSPNEDEQSAVIRESIIHWSADPVQLKELLLALELENVFADEAGNDIPFTKVVDEFSRLFYVGLGTARDVKKIVYDRTSNYMPFLDRLSSKLRSSIVSSKNIK